MGTLCRFVGGGCATKVSAPLNPSEAAALSTMGCLNALLGRVAVFALTLAVGDRRLLRPVDDPLAPVD